MIICNSRIHRAISILIFLSVFSLADLLIRDLNVYAYDIQWEPGGSHVTLISTEHLALKVHVPTNVLSTEAGNFSPELADSMDQNLLAIGERVLEAGERSLYKFFDFFDIGDYDIDIPVELWITGDIFNDEGDYYLGLCFNCQQIYINAWGYKIEETTAHEIFHCFQHSLGMWPPIQKWIVEGGAKMSEDIYEKSHNFEHNVYPKYLRHPETSLFEKSYEAALIWYEKYQTNSPDAVKLQYLAFAADTSRGTHANLLKDDWHRYALDLSNNYIVYGTNAGKKPTDHGGEINVSESGSVDILLGSYSASRWAFDLQPLSARYYFITIGAAIRNKANLIRFTLGQDLDINNDNLKISAAIKATQPDKSHKMVALKKTEKGEAYFQLCFKENTICKNDNEQDIYEDPYQIFVTITSTEPDQIFSINGTIDLFGPNRYELDEIHFNDGTLQVPDVGKFEIIIDTDNENEEDRGIYLVASKHWMAFDTEFYGWDEFGDPVTNPDVKVHPTRLTGYVNKLCRFRGNMGYDIESLGETKKLDDGWIERTFKIKRKEGDEGSGNFYKTKQKFVCGKPKAGTDLGTFGFPFYAAYAKMLAAINATDYGADSFAMKLRHIFAKNISLGLVDNNDSDTEGEVKMEFFTDQLLRIKYSDNLIFYYTKK